MDNRNQPVRPQSPDIRPPVVRDPRSANSDISQPVVSAPVPADQARSAQVQPQPIGHESGVSSPPKRRRLWLKILIGVVLGIIAAIVTVGALFVLALRPVDPTDQTARQLEIVSGSTPGQIADTLEQAGVIRQSRAFNIYTRLQGTRNSLQAGHYSFKPSQSTQEIATILSEGPGVQDIEVTFLPGATLIEGKQELLQAGFSEQEIDDAFNAQYDHPLLADRPDGADLEGYLYGETHRFAADASLADVLERFFDDYYAVIVDEDLEAKFERQGLTLYEGITLASIIQKEVSGEGDSRQVSQVFYKRLAEDIPLGADATFVYAATKNGETPSVDYPSPYNTRIHGGLPPGPISTPGVEALQAAADPAEGDYLYFVSGDDGTNHFSRTEEEHIRKTREFCKENCSLF